MDLVAKLVVVLVLLNLVDEVQGRRLVVVVVLLVLAFEALLDGLMADPASCISNIIV